MDFHVLVQVRSLSECEVAASLLALKRSFACVYSKMIKEIMPLFEVFQAIWVSAQQLLYNTLRIRVFELKYDVVPRWRNLTSFYFVSQLTGGVEVASRGYFNLEHRKIQV